MLRAVASWLARRSPARAEPPHFKIARIEPASPTPPIESVEVDWAPSDADPRLAPPVIRVTPRTTTEGVIAGVVVMDGVVPAVHLTPRADRDCDRALECPYAGYLNPHALPERFTLDVVALLKDGQRRRLARLHGSCRGIKDRYRFELEPGGVVSLGRSGSTIMLAYLACHPDIVVWEPFELEAWYIPYHARLFETLTNPRQWMAPVGAKDMLALEQPGWLGELGAPPLAHWAQYPAAAEWFAGGYVERMYRAQMDALQQWYSTVARRGGTLRARMMFEKMTPPTHGVSRRVIPGLHAIFLVRDPRDVYASIRAFDHKRGYRAFGRERFESEEAYIRHVLAGSMEMLRQEWERHKDRALLMRYEDLITDPRTELARVFRHLGLDAKRRTVDKVIEDTHAMNPAAQARHRTASTPRDSIQRFRSELEPEVIALCDEVFARSLAAFGYSPAVG